MFEHLNFGSIDPLNTHSTQEALSYIPLKHKDCNCHLVPSASGHER